MHYSRHTNTMEAEENMEDTTIIEAKEDVVPNVEEIWEGVVADVNPVNSHTTAEHMEYVPTQVPTEDPPQRATKRTLFFATKCRGMNATAPGRLGWYLLVIIM